MSRRHHRKQRFKRRSLYIWHRYAGVTAALFVVILALTGILLNHTESLELNKRYIQSDWIVDWYGIQAPQDIVSFRAGNRSITLMGEHLYLNRREIEGNYFQLSGAVLLNDIYVVAVGDSLLLLTPHGEHIERLQGKDGVPAGIKRIGRDPVAQVVLVEGSHAVYQSNTDFLHWEHYRNDDKSAIEWATPAPIEPKLMRALQNHFRDEVLPLERVLLDLHSGRFFGRLGPWIMDGAAVLLVLLAMSGTWIWLKRRR